MTCRVENGATYLQTYNAENRLSVVTQLLEGTCEEPVKTDKQWDFAYDGDGNRVRQVVSIFDPGTQEITGLFVTAYFMSGLYEVQADADENEISHRSYYAIGGMTVAMRDADGLKYLLTDHLGSTTMTSDAGGNLVSQQAYDPWGMVRSSSGTTPTDYTYTGQYSSVSDFGLMFYNARWYDPYLSRWTQPDTIAPNPANPQSLDRFAYVHNNPVRYADPSGHVGCSGSNWDDGPQCFDKDGNPKNISIQDWDKEKGVVRELPTNSPRNVDCWSDRPCITDRSPLELPTKSVFHPLDSNVVSEVPIYDHSRLIGYKITSYAYDTLHADPLVLGMGVVRAVVPVPDFSHPVSVENLDTVSSASEEFMIQPFTEALRAFHIESVCEFCGPIGIGLKALGGIKALNEGITIDAHLRTHDPYFTKSYFTTPLDELP